MGWREAGVTCSFQVHRVAYELMVGEIPRGLHVHHKCGNRLCVNPDHLGVIAQAEHNWNHHAKDYCKRGHPLATTRKRTPKGLYYCSLCARHKQRKGGTMAELSAGKKANRKGKRGEREVVQIFKKFGFDVRRTPNSGALSFKGDILGFDGFSVEIKRCERLLIPQWLRQAYADAGSKIPTLIFRMSQGPQNDPLGQWHVVLPLHDFLADQQLLRELRKELAA